MAVGSFWGCRQLQINEQSQLCFFPVDNASTDSGSDSAADVPGASPPLQASVEDPFLIFAKPLRAWSPNCFKEQVLAA